MNPKEGLTSQQSQQLSQLQSQISQLPKLLNQITTAIKNATPKVNPGAAVQNEAIKSQLYLAQKINENNNNNLRVQSLPMETESDLSERSAKLQNIYALNCIIDSG